MNSESGSKQVYKSRVDAAITFINENLSGNLNLEHIAQAAHFSPFHFHRIFAALVGETPHEFMNRIRLERAANMLIKMPSFSITEIALACGFSSSATFARAFKKHFGVTASTYRERGADLAVHPFAPLDPSDEGKRAPVLDVRVQTMPRFHVAYVSTLTGYKLDQINMLWTKLCRWADARDLITPQATMIGIS
ncbi:MAG: helix-turn-helix domain-containing protein, partial [Planctomycetes bacterium]|nr:helix-turn-helix domain-containing protein [Planctomycetota bacterium]